MLTIQKSFQDHDTGTVYVVPTPIGNLEDITYRALHVLNSVAIIAAEDTRNTKKLLNHFEIETPMISYHEHNKKSREAKLLEHLGNGDSIAIVSDAGMPGVSDPGYEIVAAAIEQEYPVVVLPGANAALCALIGSGLASTEFLFYGFLPRKKKEKAAELQRLKSMKATLLIYESPYRVKDTLHVMLEQLGNREIAIARELTKRYEEYTRGTIQEVIDVLDGKEQKGEFCIVIDGNKNADTAETETVWWKPLSVYDHVAHYIEHDQMPSKEAIKKTAADRSMPKRDVYQIYHIE